MTKRHGAKLAVEIDESSTWQALARAYSAPPIGPNEFTRRMMSEELGLSFNQTKPIIQSMLDAGKIETVGKRRTANNRPEVAYKVKQ